jgi:hypothetical protein
MIINSFQELIHLLESKPEKSAVIVMFKSQTCPPCRQTMNYLETITPSGETKWSIYAREFEVEHGIKLYFFAFDVRSASMDNNPKLLPIVSVYQSVRGLPTFDLFAIDSSGHLNHVSKARHVGGLGNGGFSTYLDICYNHLAKSKF